MKLFSIAGELLGAQAEQALKRAVSPLPFYVKRLAIGAVLILLSTVGFALTLLLLIAAFFLGLAHYDTLMAAALWSSLVSAGVGVVFLILGIRTTRKPR